MTIKRLTNEQLAGILEANVALKDHLMEAARRLRDIDLQQLLTANEIVEAVQGAPTIDAQTTKSVEQVIMAVPLSKKSSSQMSSLASRILNGAPYDDRSVKSLAASVLSQDEVRGQTSDTE